MSNFEQLDLFENSLDHDEIIFCDACKCEYNLRFHTMCPKCKDEVKTLE